MTISEFRAWLEGFSEAIGEAPTAEQWEKIKEKIGTIAAPPVPLLAPLMQYPPHMSPPWHWGEITCAQPQTFYNQISWNRGADGYGVCDLQRSLQ